MIELLNFLHNNSGYVVMLVLAVAYINAQMPYSHTRHKIIVGIVVFVLATVLAFV